MWEYGWLHRLEFLRALVEHVEICAIALTLAAGIALPLGLLATRFAFWRSILLSLSGTLYSIPSMALLVLLVPFLGLGNRSAILALTVYAQFALLRGVVLGFGGLDAELRDAASGLGYTPWQRFWRVEWPLALPSLLAGLRVASASTISIAGLAAWINAGGLGSILFEGIYQNDLRQILWGTALIAGLALLADLILLSIEKQALREAQGASS